MALNHVPAAAASLDAEIAHINESIVKLRGTDAPRHVLLKSVKMRASKLRERAALDALSPFAIED